MGDKIFILVGAMPSDDLSQNPGGQLTASLGLMQYARDRGYELMVIDTTQRSFPVPPIYMRLQKGIRRVLRLSALLRKKKVNGVILFSGFGLSFYERVFMSIICRMFCVKDLFLSDLGIL